MGIQTMTEDARQEGDPRVIRTVKPGDRVLRVRTHKRRLPLIERRVGGPIAYAVDLFAEIAMATPVLSLLFVLLLMVVVAPVPIYLFERGAEDPEFTSYGVGLWWAVAAMTTAGYSGVDLLTTGGRIVGSIYTIASVSLFYGSVLGAFSSYFFLTWRRPKGTLVESVAYYLQRLDGLTVEQLDDLAELSQGVMQAARVHARARPG